MAQVDFSNAVLSVDTSVASRANPVSQTEININATGSLSDVNNNSITTNFSATRVVNEQYQLAYVYTGQFTASGTEFYLWKNRTSSARWKVSNISFNAGDTFSFKIRADLICQ